MRACGDVETPVEQHPSIRRPVGRPFRLRRLDHEPRRRAAVRRHDVKVAHAQDPAAVPGVLPRVELNASRRPSGDHTGKASIVGSDVIGVNVP